MTDTRLLAVLEPGVADRRQTEGAGGNVPGVTTDAERTARIHAQERLAVESGWVELDDDDVDDEEFVERVGPGVESAREVIPFTAERQEYVNKIELKGGEIPQSHRATPEDLADHCNRMICSFWDWPGNPYSNGELVYRVTLGALRRMQQLAAMGRRAQTRRAKVTPLEDRPVDYAVETQPCDSCGAAIGTPCKVEISGRKHDGAHHARLNKIKP